MFLKLENIVEVGGVGIPRRFHLCHSPLVRLLFQWISGSLPQ